MPVIETFPSFTQGLLSLGLIFIELDAKTYKTLPVFVWKIFQNIPQRNNVLTVLEPEHSLFQAGITTTLNSRCSVLAAANSVFGRWDDTKGEENIDFMPTILSRFDMIFVVKDEHDEKRDTVSIQLREENIVSA